MIKEACVESLIDAIEAEKRGADRIELCDNLSQGGTTPSYGTIKLALSTLKIPVFPINKFLIAQGLWLFHLLPVAEEAEVLLRAENGK